MAAAGEAVELSDRDDVLDLGDEVVFGQAEQIDRRLAGVQAGADGSRRQLATEAIWPNPGKAASARGGNYEERFRWTGPT